MYYTVAENISLVRTEPDDPQQLPCPHQRQEFQCQIMLPVLSLAWTLPNGAILEFGPLRDVGDIRNSSDGNYLANLTYKMRDSAQDSDRFLYTSTLLVFEPANGSYLTCGELDGSLQLIQSLTTSISGMSCTITIRKQWNL